jgi:hypothetical protein
LNRTERVNISRWRRERVGGGDGERVGPVGHVSDGAEGEDEGSVGVGAAVLPPAEGGGEEIALRTVGLSDDGGEPAVREERVGGPADTDGVVVVGLVGEGTPLGGLVDGVRLQDEAALGAHRVPRRVVERHLRLLLAVRAEGVAHLACPLHRLCSRAAGGVLEEERGDLGMGWGRGERGGGRGSGDGGGAVLGWAFMSSTRILCLVCCAASGRSRSSCEGVAGGALRFGIEWKEKFFFTFF